MEENILCAICSENISYSDATVWFTREDGAEVLLCDECCQMLDAAESRDDAERQAAAEYFRRRIDIYTAEDVAGLLEQIFLPD